MISITESESKVIDFLIRNPTDRFSIRNIAQKIGLTAPAAHKLLKNLENDGVVSARKLGSGLFYEIVLGNNVARNLAAFVLSQSAKALPESFEELKNYSEFALQNGENILAVVKKDNEYKANNAAMKLNKKTELISNEEFVSRLKKRDKATVDRLKTAAVLWGELNLIDMIKEVY